MRIYYDGIIEFLDLERVAKKVYRMTDDDYGVSADGGGKFLEIKTSKAIDAVITFDVQDNGMKGYLSVYPAINGGKTLDSGQIEGFLTSNQNLYAPAILRDGLSQVIRLFKDNRIVENVLVAAGKPPVNGADAQLNFGFDSPSTDVSHAKGRVDYRQMSTIINVTKDQLLIRKEPPTEGTAGFTVVGKELPPVKGADVTIRALDNVRESESKLEYYANLEGHVIFKNGNLSVFPVLTVSGNVDFRSGNIDFVGLVEIKQDVLPGFIVKGTSIVVGGICQDAILEAKEDITIKVGVKGGSKGRIVAGRNLHVGYAENAKLTAKENISIGKYAFNCTMNAGEAISCQSKECIIAGGTIRFFSEASLQNVGTRENTNLTIIGGQKYDLEEKLRKVAEEKGRIHQSMEKIDEVLAQLDLKNPAILKNPKVRQLLEARSALNKNLAALERRADSVIKASQFPNPMVHVHQTIQDGIVIRYFDATMKVPREMKRMRFSYQADPAEVMITPMT